MKISTSLGFGVDASYIQDTITIIGLLLLYGFTIISGLIKTTILFEAIKTGSGIITALDRLIAIIDIVFSLFKLVNEALHVTHISNFLAIGVMLTTGFLGALFSGNHPGNNWYWAALAGVSIFIAFLNLIFMIPTRI